MPDEKKMVDLHMHSNASDGLYGPAELINLTYKSGVAAAAITDHDTVQGLDEAVFAGLQNGLEVIPGVEISVTEENQEIHILGFFPRYLDQLNIALLHWRNERFNRMESIIRKLNLLSFNITMDEILGEAGKAAPGRLHLARLMVKKGYVQNLEHAFSAYLNPNRPAYVARRTMNASQSIALLLEVQAIPVLAHPGIKGKNIIPKLLPLGLKGIEVFHPDHSVSMRKYYKQLAQKKGLVITGGSDFHGDNLLDIPYSQKAAIPYHYLEQMKYLCS